MVYWKIDSYLTVCVLKNRLLFNSKLIGVDFLPENSLFTGQTYYQKTANCFERFLSQFSKKEPETTMKSF